MVYQTDPETGKRLEPIEDVVVDVDEDFSGIVIEKLSARKAELKDMGPSGAGKTRLAFKAPSRALIGYQGEFLTDTRGSGVLNRVFSHYEPYKGAIEGRRNGALISNSRRRDRLVRAVEPRGSRHDVRRRRREDLPGHDHRRELQA